MSCFSAMISSGSFNDHQQVHASIVWSDDDEDEHNQSFLPIGLPPTHHRSLISTALSPRHHQDTSVHREQPDHIDVVRIRPLNNLSAFNFDYQQLNESHTSPETSARRTIFSTELDQAPALSREQPRILPPHPPSSQSSVSSTPVVQQSFTSDTSVIDSHWLREQQRLRDLDEYRVPSPTTLFDRSGANQVGVRIDTCDECEYLFALATQSKSTLGISRSTLTEFLPLESRDGSIDETSVTSIDRHSSSFGKSPADHYRQFRLVSVESSDENHHRSSSDEILQ